MAMTQLETLGVSFVALGGVGFVVGVIILAPCYNRLFGFGGCIYPPLFPGIWVPALGVASLAAGLAVLFYSVRMRPVAR